MALGSDVRDILELDGAEEKDEFITKEALFSDPKKVCILICCQSVYNFLIVKIHPYILNCLCFTFIA